MAAHIQLSKQPIAPAAIYRMVRMALLVVVASLVWTLVMPGIVARIGGVFYREGTLQKVPQSVRDALRVFDEQQAKREEQLRTVDDALFRAAAESPSVVPGLLQFRDHTEELLRTAKPPFTVIPFHLNPQLFLFPVMYTCLGWLIIIFVAPQSGTWRTTLRSSWFWVVGALIYVLFQWPLWMRNFVLSNEGRTVYAYPNFDVHPASFVGQELIIAGFCLLLSRLWFQWIAHYSATRDSLRTEGPALAEVLRGEGAQELREMFTQWQIASVVLAIGFLLFTRFYWMLVAGFNDQRYVLSAIVVHALWAVSWALLAMPLIIRWRHWSGLQRRAIAELTKSDLPIEERRFAVDSIRNINPLSSVSLSVSGIAGALSFALPVVQVFRKWVV